MSTGPGAAALLNAPAWSAEAMVDLCERALGGPESLDLLVRRIQLLEWELLFDYCHRAAFGLPAANAAAAPGVAKESRQK